MPPEDGPLSGLLDTLRRKYREITGRDEPPTLHDEARRRAMMSPENLLAWPDDMAQYQVPPPPPLPMPVLEAETGQPLSDQARRLGNLTAADQGRAPEIRNVSGIEAAISSPLYQRGKLALEIASDFSPYGMAKDVGAGIVSALRGNMDEAVGYSLATIPFIGRSLKEARRGMKPFHPVGVFNEITPEMMDPDDIYENLIFAQPRYMGDAAFRLNPNAVVHSVAGTPGTPDAVAKARRLAYSANAGQRFAEMPLLGLAPATPESRIRVMRELGVIRPREADEMLTHLAYTRDRMLGRGVDPIDVKYRDGLQNVVDASKLDVRIKEVLDTGNPRFPGVFGTHDGRNRGVKVDYDFDRAGVPETERIMPIRLRVAEDVPRELLDNPLAFREQPYDYPDWRDFEFVDAPLSGGRIEEQAGIARALRNDLAHVAANDPTWASVWDRPVYKDSFRDDANVLRMRGGRQAIEDADRAVSYMAQRYNRGIPLTSEAERARDDFLDYLRGTLDAGRRELRVPATEVDAKRHRTIMDLWREANASAQEMNHIGNSLYPESP